MENVLQKMAEFAGHTNVNWKDGSHLSLGWTLEQENTFRDWLVHELLNNKEIRMEMMRYPIKNSKYIKRAVSEFLCFYGFKTI